MLTPPTASACTFTSFSARAVRVLVPMEAISIGVVLLPVLPIEPAAASRMMLPPRRLGALSEPEAFRMLPWPLMRISAPVVVSPATIRSIWMADSESR